MIRLLALLPLLIALPALAQEAAPPPPSAPPVAQPATVAVVLTTSSGPITIEVETERAPITSANFLRYVDQKRLDGATFYRAAKVEGVEGSGFIQGGVRNDPKRVLPSIAHEPTSQTGVKHVDGAISMARAEPGSANGDFFIILGPMPYMDADPARPGDNLGYAAFGRVLEGMDVVRTILAAPTSPTEGEGVMKGQMLDPKITILSAKRR